MQKKKIKKKKKKLKKNVKVLARKSYDVMSDNWKKEEREC